MDKTSVYYNLGLTNMENKDHIQSVDHFTKIIELKPNHSDSYFQLGCIYFEKEDYDEALKNYRLALKYDSNHGASIYYNMALILQNKYENYDEAKTYYELSLQINPKKSEAHNNLALLLQYHFKDYLVAKKHFMEAIRYDSKCAYYYYNLGLWYELYDNGHSQKNIAHEYYQIGHIYIDNINDISNMYYNLALWLQRHIQNSNYEVSKIFSLVLQLNPNHNYVKEEQKKIQNDASIHQKENHNEKVKAYYCDDNMDECEENDLMEINSLSIFKKIQRLRLVKKHQQYRNQLNNAEGMYLLF